VWRGETGTVGKYRSSRWLGSWQIGKAPAGSDSRKMQEQQMAWIGRQGRQRLAGTVGKCRSSRWLARLGRQRLAVTLPDRKGRFRQGQ
jgi:hypothetical protein